MSFITTSFPHTCGGDPFRKNVLDTAAEFPHTSGGDPTARNPSIFPTQVGVILSIPWRGCFFWSTRNDNQKVVIRQKLLLRSCRIELWMPLFRHGNLKRQHENAKICRVATFQLSYAWYDKNLVYAFVVFQLLTCRIATFDLSCRNFSVVVFFRKPLIRLALKIPNI